MQLDKPAECASGGDPLPLYKILHLLFSPLVWILCALCLEGRQKLSTWSWCRTFRISVSSAERCLTNPFRTLWLCSWVIGKTPGLISHNNFVKIIFVCIGHFYHVLAGWHDLPFVQVSMSVEQNVHTTFSFPSWECSNILLSFLMRLDSHFSPNQHQQQCLPQFESIFDGHLSLSSTSSLPFWNREYHLKMFDWFRASFP